MTRKTLARGAAAGALALAALACNADRLFVPNYQNPTPESIRSDPLQAIQVLSTGVLRGDRDNALDFVNGTGILGRESYNYTPTEGRNTSGWLTSDVNSQASFGGVSNWTGPYRVLRNIRNLIDLVNDIPEPTLSAAQKSAMLGFAHTMEALTLSYIISFRHNLGIVVDVSADPLVLSPFVSRDSAYNYIIGRLEQGKTELAAGGTSFPIVLHA